MGWKPTTEQQTLFNRLVDEGLIIEQDYINFLDRHSQPGEEKEVQKILERLIAATGITDVNSNITSANFKIREEPDDRELVLSHLNRLATTEEVYTFMRDEGIQPEGPEYLARYAKDHPDEGLEYPVVALDKEKLWQGPGGGLGCVVLWGDGGGGVRRFNLGWIDRRWCAFFRFLGSRKLKP